MSVGFVVTPGHETEVRIPSAAKLKPERRFGGLPNPVALTVRVAVLGSDPAPALACSPEALSQEVIFTGTVDDSEVPPSTLRLAAGAGVCLRFMIADLVAAAPVVLRKEGALGGPSLPKRGAIRPDPFISDGKQTAAKPHFRELIGPGFAHDVVFEFTLEGNEFQSSLSTIERGRGPVFGFVANGKLAPSE
jgi:hypothetical protein